jgi:hypothetical protein
MIFCREALTNAAQKAGEGFGFRTVLFTRGSGEVAAY